MKENYYKERLENYGMGHTRRGRIISLVKGSGLRVLDIGCGTGSLGALIKKEGNWVGGVELSDQAAAEARTRLDQVWQFDIESEWPAELQKQDIDVVVIAEVLEHVFDPVIVLKHIRGSLKQDGHVVITTPNFLTWTNRVRFLFGSFAYQMEGMFDFGHIRWFTYAYLKKVLTEAGFTIREERHVIFPGKLTRILKNWPSLFAWQFVAKAKRT